MKFLKASIVLTLVVASLAPSFAQERASPPASDRGALPPANPLVSDHIAGLPVWLGDTSQQVKDAYQTKLEPEPSESAVVRGTTQLRLKTKGVAFFFNRDDKIYTIRLEAPFAAPIRGVKIGDTAQKLVKVMGKPAKITKPPTGMASNFLPRSYTYYLDDVTTANFQVNADDEIEVVFLVK